MKKSLASRTIKAGKQTFFLDVYQTKEKEKPYLLISESQLVAKPAEGQQPEYKRTHISVFDEDIEAFQQALNEVVTQLRTISPKPAPRETTPAQSQQT